MGVFVVRAFVQLRGTLSTHKELALKLEELEKKVGLHDEAIVGLIEAIRQLMEEPVQDKETNRIHGRYEGIDSGPEHVSTFDPIPRPCQRHSRCGS